MENAENIVPLLINQILTSSKEIINEFGEEARQFFNIYLKKYLEKQQKEYSMLKTLLRGNTPVYIYDIYFPLKLQAEGKIIDTILVNSIFDKSNFVTVIGSAGSGKSTLIKHFFLNCIETKSGIPIMIELRNLNEFDGSFQDYLIEKLLEAKLTNSARILNKLLEQGRFIFFLDGYDELTKEIKPKTVGNIKTYASQFEKNKYIITSRPYSDVEQLPTFHNLQVCPLDSKKKEIDQFILKQLHDQVELAQRIIKSISSNQSIYINEFLTNPLLLTLYILTFQSNASVPEKKYIFYRRVINALFAEHDSKTKLGFVRQKQSSLNQEQFEQILKAFCFVTFFEEQYVWDFDYVNDKLQQLRKKLANEFSIYLFINDLKSAIALWIDDNGQLSFAHRSLQEYFAALCIHSLGASQNEQAYRRIADVAVLARSYNEVENFLSLCEEMDTLNFYRNYYKPLLDEVRQTINGKSIKDKARSLLLFFAESIKIAKSRGDTYLDGAVVRSDLLYKSIYVHFDHTLKLHATLKKICGERELFELVKSDLVEVKSPGKQERGFYRLSFEKGIPETFLDYVYPHIYKIVENFDKFLDEKMLSIDLYIENKRNQDQSLVDMIT
jgi:ABC-type cobalamin/Fe3+-siderophores transport system ATPase subunit